jgi:hypothetical protein
VKMMSFKFFRKTEGDRENRGDNNGGQWSFGKWLTMGTLSADVFSYVMGVRCAVLTALGRPFLVVPSKSLLMSTRE